jgi:glycosyltransferase involved in cell wall biosynthesis
MSDAFSETHSAVSAAITAALLAQGRELPPIERPELASHGLLAVSSDFAPGEAGRGVRTVNIDISDLYRTRGRTGIQRVVREVVTRLLSGTDEHFAVRILAFDDRRKVFDIVDHGVAAEFLATDLDELAVTGSLALSDFTTSDVFYDLDSAWNSPLGRPELYRALHEVGVTIVSTVYDLAPLRHPDFVHDTNLRDWALHISAVYTWSDIVLLPSRSAEREFLDFAGEFGVDRHIPTLVTRVGSDFAAGGRLSEREQKVADRFAGSRFMLVVGIETREGRSLALEAMTQIHRVDPDVHLVIAGGQGWESDATVRAVNEHPVSERRIHWLGETSNELLQRLYDECTLSWYLSDTGGFGLPVAEALLRGKVTIASRIGAVFEVGRGFADYLHFGTPGELAETALAYLSDSRLREAREEQIRTGYRAPTWDLVARTISGMFARLDRADVLLSRPRPEKLQFVFISNVPESLARTVALIDRYIPWVDHYLIAAPAALRERILAIPTPRRIVFISDEALLGDRMAEFRAADHQRKNWILRSSVTKLPEVADEFIMLDDDNQPLAEVPMETFLDGDRRYRGHYFYELPAWPHRTTEYDQGQHMTERFLDEQGLELLSYSAHQPQIIDKALFGEVVSMIEAEAAHESLDEWSVYFNALAAWYPTLLVKRAFLTMNWPDSPGTWQAMIDPGSYLFENYYEEVYESGPFSMLDDLSLESKTQAKVIEAGPYRRSRSRYESSLPVLAELDMAHGALVFEKDGNYLVVEGVPHLVVCGTDPTLKLTLNFTRIGHRTEGTETQFCYRILGVDESYGLIVDDAERDITLESCGLIELLVQPTTLKPGAYAIEFFAKFGGENVFPDKAMYRSRVLVAAADDTLAAALAKL